MPKKPDPSYWKKTFDALSEKDKDRVSRGLQCPGCSSILVRLVGYNPDGINTNAAYDCLKCPAIWEGY